MDEDHKTITVERPTGPRVTASEPRSLGQLVSIKAKSASKSVVATAVTISAATVTVLTKHKFATAIGASAVMAVTTHFIVAIMMMGIITNTTSVPFQGPLDIVSGAKIFWGFRAPSAAYAATLGKLANICTALDAVCADVNSDANGNFNLSGTGSLLCNNIANVCTVKTLYDTSGTNFCVGSVPCDVTNATIATRPTLVVAGAANGCPATTLPCMAFASGAFLQSAANVTAPANPITGSVVAKRTGNTSAFNTISCMACGGIQLLFASSANLVAMYEGNNIPTASASDNAYHAVQFIINAASSSFYIDGSSSAVSLTVTGPGAAPMGVGPANGVGNNFVGNLAEAGYWAVGFSGAQQTNMNSNQHSYWGF